MADAAGAAADNEEEEKPILAAAREISFFLAPWRRRVDKGPAHYLTVGTACAVYLFVAGGYLTYLVYTGQFGKEQSRATMAKYASPS